MNFKRRKKATVLIISNQKYFQGICKKLRLKGFPRATPWEILRKLRHVFVSFTSYCVATQSHPSCRILEQSTALWVSLEDRAPLPCTSRSRTVFRRLSQRRGVSKLPESSVSVLSSKIMEFFSRIVLTNFFLSSPLELIALQRHFFFAKHSNWWIKTSTDKYLDFDRVMVFDLAGRRSQPMAYRNLDRPLTVRYSDRSLLDPFRISLEIRIQKS